MPVTDTQKLLKTLIEERQTIQLNVQAIETQIYEFEGSYLRETSAYGNAVKGWTAKGFEKAETDLAANRKTETKPLPEDRIFSNSSVTLHAYGNKK